MSLYRRGKYWHYKIKFGGQVLRESTKSTSKTIAREAERARRRQLEEGFNGIARPERAQIFSVVAEKWLTAKRTHLAPRSVIIERMNLKHIFPFFGKSLLCDMTADDISEYQAKRLNQGAAHKTINLEVGTLRAILRKKRLWANIQPDVKMLKVAEDVGRALSREEEKRLLDTCAKSRSRSLYPAFVLALNTAMRLGEIRTLRWNQIDLKAGILRVGKSKTPNGTGRAIPLNQRAWPVLDLWRSNFPNAKPEHFVFPHEKYGQGGPYEVNPTEPIHSWKTAWETARERACVKCRFHDLRHTCISRLAESEASDATIMSIAGHVSRRMLEHYSHIRMEAKRRALEAITKHESEAEGAQKGAQSLNEFKGTRAN